jgi:GrpB-like predicted nucleotidyltransferase (UPF0157 family)
MSVEVVPYSPQWPTQFDRVARDLRAALAGVPSAAVEHVGSTSVPGLAAKPVIDLMAAVHDLTHARPHQAALAGLGFHPHDNGMVDRLLYVRVDSGVRTHILHVVSLESWPTRNQRIFRDYLRTHPEAAARYARLKREIVVAGTASGEYARAKTVLVQEFTDRARAELGLPSEPVWEKQRNPSTPS